MGDVVGICFDCFADHQRSFEFYVNAAGVKCDGITSKGGETFERNWDAIWDAKTSIHADGWTAEMRIPFSQLRFHEKSQQIWGLELYRFIQRKQELSCWRLIPKETTQGIAYYGELHGLENIIAPRQIEIMPYLSSSVQNNWPEPGNPLVDKWNRHLSMGLDGKIGLSSNFMLDWTIHPDFGQVEADPSEVNLTGFETFFPEKRPFFIEGQDIFSFRLMTGDGGFSNDQLFYSRRIGRSPHYDPDLEDEEYLNEVQQTSIIGACKLSGKTRNGFSVGIVDAVTAEESATIASSHDRRKIIVEPLTNYFAARTLYEHNKGTTRVGGMITAVNRRIETDELDFLHREAYTGGLDFNHFWNQKNWQFNLTSAFSHVRGSEESIRELQESSLRYFQRPDADYKELDTTRTTLSGHGGNILVGKLNGGHWRYMLGTLWRSPGFETNDLGYTRQADYIMEYIWAGFRWWTPWSIFQSVNMNFNQWRSSTFGIDWLNLGGNINFNLTFKNYCGLSGGLNLDADGFSASALRGGPSLRYDDNYHYWVAVNTDERKSWLFSAEWVNWWSSDQISLFRELAMEMTWRPKRALTLSAEGSYTKNIDDMQYVDTYDYLGESAYLLGRINQNTLRLTLKLNCYLTPNLSIQFYGQPFVSAAEYDRFKRVVSARADKYSQRYTLFASDQFSQSNEEIKIDY